ncbi:M6 family metalloprotease domain-containing protein [Pedococcus bigeumensis]|uniref:M6 family metalloprotease domain-containing protein n=2 Tax=Pedococcus bigeumensis TaxID=433644 RepID=A0A502D560_9MICO|nr:M6 family metalloprotease domain-containing protein [Pedococcus bigeumensis]
MSMASAPAQATPVQGDKEPKANNRAHDLPNPLGDAQRALRDEAVQKLVKGEATTETRGGQRVIKLKGNAKAPKGSKAAKDRYVSYPVEREEDIFTVLADFGTQTKAATGGTAGPVHNQIPSPDRNWDGSATDDNSTYWESDFNTQHYKDMMFGQGESFKDFYTKLSNGRFLAKGDVSDWVKVPYNEASYGSNKQSDAAGYWPFVADTAAAWYNSQKAAGKSDAEIKTYLAQFDKVDRYDFDGDGNFNEPDGYIDHFQAIHAGEGEEAGGGAQGEDAIWSHRWYAYSNNQGKTGPAGNLLGGVPLGNSGMWIGDYTTEPENGGLGVFSHEFGHDLGLPDLYDTAGGDNGTGFWTLMSGGSWLNHGTDSIGTTPGYMGAWEKLQLGWLDYKTVPFGQDMTVKVGPSGADEKTNSQAVVVPLPDKTVTTSYNTPHSGTSEWWGGAADGLNTTLSRGLDLTGKSSASVSAWLQYNIEQDYDALFAEVSTDGGATWAQVGSLIDGPTGNAALTPWAQKTWDLSAYAGKNITFRFRYNTDGGLHYEGAFLDDLAITVDGANVLTDTVENGDNGWTASGFTRMSGSTSVVASHYYIAENRVYQGYDKTLQTGPYNFGYANTRPDWVERFPYQNGLLVSYVDGAYGDNNTSAHPGHGQVLPVDARPEPVRFYDGTKLGNRRQPFDATFGQEATDAVTFHKNGIATVVPSQKAIPVFDDSDPMKYWSAANPWSSVQVAGEGVRMAVTKTDDGGNQLQVKVTFK